MKLHPAAPTSLNVFSGYGADYVLVNGVRHERPVIVTPEQVLPWGVRAFEALTAGDFEPLLGLNPEIVLLGTGARQRFPAPPLTRALAARRIGVEAMDLQAACRTYNILMAESRVVVAALVFE